MLLLSRWQHSSSATTLHLQHEIVLLVSLFFLTTSSLMSIYRQSFGTLGDWKIIFTITLWLSRHLLFRMLCTGNNCTSSTQSRSSLWSRLNVGQWLTKYCSSGQYFDAPSRAAILAASSGGDHHNNHSNTVFNSSFANSTPHDYVILPLLKFYYWALSVKQSNNNDRNLFTNLFSFKAEKKSKRSHRGDFQDINNHGNNSSSRRSRVKHTNSSSGSNANHKLSQNHNLQKILSSKVYKQLEQLWEHLPSPQLSFAFISGIFCIAAIILFHPNIYNPNIYPNSAPSTAVNLLSASPHNTLSRGNIHINPNSNHQNNFRNTNNMINHGINRGEFENSQHSKNGINMHTTNFGSNGGSAPDYHNSNQHYNDQNMGNSKFLYHPFNVGGNSNVAPYLLDYVNPQNTYFSDPFGFRSPEPSALKLFLFIAACGTLSSLVLYGRAILPIPDLTASINVMESVKILSKSSSQHSYSRHQGGISMSLSPNPKNSMSSSKKKDKDAPWAEQFKSIKQENRLVMISKIILLRTIENVFVCAILPHSYMVCKIANHCDPYPLLWERFGSFALDSWRISGHHGVGKDASMKTTFDSIHIDSLLKFLIVVSISLTTVVLLLAQAVTLDKSYLSNMAFLGGELMERKQNQQTSPNETATISSGAGGDRQQSNTNRRNKKGGGVNHGSYNNTSHNSTNSITDTDNVFPSQYQNGLAKINPFLKAAHLLFKYDLGHPSTSSVTAITSMVQILFTIYLFNLYLYYEAAGLEFMALILILAANIVATSGTCCIGVMDYREIEKLGIEISGGQ